MLSHKLNSTRSTRAKKWELKQEKKKKEKRQYKYRTSFSLQKIVFDLIEIRKIESKKKDKGKAPKLNNIIFAPKID